jgi:uncharacterized cofD-like protein
MESSTKIVTIGGGTGTHTVLSGLKKYPFDLTAIVTVADSGGSTGRLRDEFGALPVGDFRMALTALAATDEEADILRELFLYRFNKGKDGLRGHNFGNLFLVAMADVLGSYEKAIEYASKILRINGTVVPITSAPVDLCAEYEDGSILEEEAVIDEPAEGFNGKQRIVDLWIQPNLSITKEAMRAILEAEFIVLGPGDLYTSIFPNLVVKGTKAAIKKSRAKIIYVVNLITKYGQTYKFTARDHVDEITKYLEKSPDFVLVNSIELPERILKKYKEEKNFPVKDNLKKKEDFEVIRADVLVPREIQKREGDAVRRSLIRHDPDKLAWEIVKIVKETDLTTQI